MRVLLRAGLASAPSTAPRVMALALCLALCLTWGVATDLVARRWTTT